MDDLFSSRFVRFLNAKTARRLRGYLIRLTREYTDGGMDSHAEQNTSERLSYVCEKKEFFEGFFQKPNVLKPFANVRSAVRVFTGEAGVTFAKS